MHIESWMVGKYNRVTVKVGVVAGVQRHSEWVATHSITESTRKCSSVNDRTFSVSFGFGIEEEPCQSI